ncbi:hypothetical protein M514_09559 [Trichuris suis]|uniref:Uncharacterized protein n=1 Tax=Trichuris suis TaxID=68888 RepID=A0A085LX38_9BILA|nr:hypothetical protein M513_09559 [Trichuris suis]KFD70311.1 hypothetical protein M514_09559 [Trichuris suis]
MKAYNLLWEIYEFFVHGLYPTSKIWNKPPMVCVGQFSRGVPGCVQSSQTPSMGKRRILDHEFAEDIQ